MRRGRLILSLGAPGEKELAVMGVSYCAPPVWAFYRKALGRSGWRRMSQRMTPSFLRASVKSVSHLTGETSYGRQKASSGKLLSLENVEIIWDSEVEEIPGSEMVEGIKICYQKEQRKKIRSDVEGVRLSLPGLCQRIPPLLNDLVEMDEKRIHYRR